MKRARVGGGVRCRKKDSGRPLCSHCGGSAAGREPGIHNHRSRTMDSGLASASLRRPGMTRLWSHRFRQTLKTWRRSWHDALYQSGQGHAVRKQGDHKGRPYSETVYAASLEIRLARGREVIVNQMLIVLGADVFG